MSDLASLLLILLFFYTTDCLFWLHPGSVAFVRRSWARWTLVPGGAGIGNREGGLAMANPLPGLDQTFICHALPVSFSPQGVLSFATVLPSMGIPDQVPKSIGYDDMRSVEACGADIVINGIEFAKCRGTEQAAMIRDTLQKLAPLPPGQRETELRRLLDGSLDEQGARHRIDEFRKRTTTLRIACFTCFFYVFIALPCFVWHYGITTFAVPFLVAALLMSSMISLGFYRVHGSLFGGDSGDRVSSSVIMALFPPTAIRAGDLLSRRLLRAYHPLAVASILCERPTLEDFARRLLIDIRNPVLPDFPDETGACIEKWHREHLERTVVDFLERRGIRISALLKPPPLLEEVTRSYCPRCLCQYALTEGECSDCPGIALLPVKRDDENASSVR